MSLPDWVKPDVSFLYGREDGVLWHVRGLVDDRAVCRCWMKSKRRWRYEALDQFFFEVSAGRIFVKTKGTKQ